MPVSDIYGGNALVQPKSIQDFTNENMLMQGKRQQLQSGALALQESQMNLQKNQNMLAQRNALTQAIQNGDIDLSNPDHAPRALALAPDVAGGMLKSIGDYQKDQATVVKDNGAGAASQAEAQTKHYNLLKNATGVISANPTPDVVNSVLTQYAQMTGRPVDETRKLFDQAGNNPEAIKQLADGFAIDAEKKMQDQTQQRGQTLTSDTQIATNAASNKSHLAGISMQQAGENSRSALQRQTQMTVAGLNPDGTPRAVSGIGTGGDIDVTKVAPADLAAAYRYKTDGTLPPNMGRGTQGAAEALRIRTIAAALDSNSGESPEDARVRQLALKGDVTAINTMRKREVAVGANVKNFDFNADQALQLSGKVDRTGVPMVNAWINAGRRSVTGNPDLAAFDVAVKTTVNEFAQIVSGTTSGATTEGEKKKAESLLNAQQTPEGLMAVINQMKVESRNRMQSFAAQRTESMPSNLPRSAPAAAPSAAPAAAGGGWKYIGPAK